MVTAWQETPTVAVYSRDGRMMGWVTAPVTLKVTPRWIDVGTAEIELRNDDPMAPHLREPGARVLIQLRGGHLLGGLVTAWTHKGPADATWTFTITDDAQVLERILAAPSPDQPLTAQSTGEPVYNAPLETVVKTLVAGNAPRAGIPVDVVASRGRGPVVVLPVRWQPIADVVRPSLRAHAHLAPTVRWQPETGKLLLDVAESRRYGIELSVESRTITEYDLSSQAPTATRVITGPQEGSSFQQIRNAEAETMYGPLAFGETFRAAATADEASTAVSEALDDGNAKSGMSLSLSESPFVRYGGPTGLHVGDIASLRVGDVVIEDVVREVTVQWQAGQPLKITPAVGAWESHPAFALARATARMAATLRRVTRR